MSKRAVIVRIYDKGDEISYVAEVKPLKGKFAAAELEGYLETSWTDKVGAAPEFSGIPSYSETDNSVTLVCAEGVSLREFRKVALDLIGEFFVVHNVS